MDTLAVIAYQTSQYQPEPRFASTVELSLADMLSTEAQADHEREEMLAYIRTWAREGGN